MPAISQADLRKMRNHYRHDVAQFLARKASEHSLITYGDLSDEFGGIDRGWGNALGGIALRCHEKELPILSVIVVSKDTRMPSTDAVLYKDLGMNSPAEIAAEQVRCFQQDWRKVKLI